MEFLVKNKDRDLLTLPDSIVEEIVERALKLKRCTEDHALVRFLIRLKKTSSVFELLELEKSRVTNTYEKLVQNKIPIESSFTPLSNYQTN